MPHSGDGSTSTAAELAKARRAGACTQSHCGSQGVVTLAGQDFCLQHFLAKCYERLDSIEPVVRGCRLNPQEASTVRSTLEECANQTLLVCLRQQSLNNLERSRLLEILLQCGDLQVLLHRPIRPLS